MTSRNANAELHLDDYEEGGLNRFATKLETIVQNYKDNFGGNRPFMGGHGNSNGNFNELINSDLAKMPVEELM